MCVFFQLKKQKNMDTFNKYPWQGQCRHFKALPNGKPVNKKTAEEKVCPQIRIYLASGFSPRLY